MKSLSYIGHASLGRPGSAVAKALLLTPKVARADEDHSGLEGTLQRIELRFPSLGSAITFDF